MWENIGRKLQSLAKVLCWIGIVISVISGIVIMAQSNRYQSTILTGILYIVVGCLFSWISSWALYGLGIVVEYVESNKGSSTYTDTSAGYAFHGIKTSDGGTITSGSYWTCPGCQTRNPMSKVTCKQCGKVR